jgi:hypothetical protein
VNIIANLSPCMCLILLAALCAGFPILRNHSQESPAKNTALARRYALGQKLVYRMNGDNDGWKYQAQANGEVERDAKGRFYEEYRWSNLVSNGQPLALTPISLGMRQDVSLEPDFRQSIPNLGEVQPALIGPITDFLTFYVDLQLAISHGLSRAGDHAFVRYGRPSSWADGRQTLLGQSCIDFDLALTGSQGDTATVVVRHVPPADPQIKFPADWMRAPVGQHPNNWIQIKKTNSGKFDASIGQETFEVTLKVSTRDGEILSGTLDNLVELVTRECDDSALDKCGPSSRHQIRRQIEMALQNWIH